MTPKVAPPSSPLSVAPNLRKAVDQLFRNFAVTYGHIWRSQFKDETFLAFAKNEWSEALLEFDCDIVLKATLASRKRFEMPPTLVQVFNLCKELKNRERPSGFLRRLDTERGSKEVALAHLKQIKNKLNLR